VGKEFKGGKKKWGKSQLTQNLPKGTVSGTKRKKNPPDEKRWGNHQGNLSSFTVASPTELFRDERRQVLKKG